MAALQSRARTTNGLGVAHRVGRRLACRGLAGEPDPEGCRAGESVAWRAFGPVSGAPVYAAAFPEHQDRKSTRLNSSHGYISYAVFCLKKKKKIHRHPSYHE